jgi:phosphate transport system permease protein
MHKVKEYVFGKGILSCGAVILLLLGGILTTLIIYSKESIIHSGFSFFGGAEWDPVFKEYGVLPFLAGTLYTSFLALLLSLPFAVSVALLLSEYMKEGAFASLIKSSVELLAGIPSVVYGFWGLFVLVPVIRGIQMRLGIVPYGVGVLTSSLILTIMIIPYSASISREMMQMVPSDLKEAAFSLGATKFEVIRRVVLPYARSGIFAGILLSLGRALGETMAVTMVIGNVNDVPKSVFAPGNTMASVIANEFAEAAESLHVSSLVNVALVLFLVTSVVNVIGRFVIKKLSMEES